MARLGLWGPGNAFSSFPQFLEAFANRGVGALELVRVPCLPCSSSLASARLRHLHTASLALTGAT